MLWSFPLNTPADNLTRNVRTSSETLYEHIFEACRFLLPGRRYIVGYRSLPTGARDCERKREHVGEREFQYGKYKYECFN